MPQKNTKEPEDIFADSDTSKPVDRQKVLTRQKTQARKNVLPVVAPVPVSSAGAGSSSKSNKKVILYFVAAFVLLAAIVAVAFAKGLLVTNKDSNTVVSNSNKAVQVINTNQPVFSPTNVNAAVDSDGDGLSDAEEAILGTNPNSQDTDGDGLFDREEVKVYKTNPLVKDTDGDGYTDGQEVQSGNNPNGPGKLFDLQTELNKNINTNTQ